MSIAIDTSVLVAIFKGEKGFEYWFDLLAELAEESPLVACEIVWAEVGSSFLMFQALRQNMELLNVVFDPVLPETAHRAGMGFRAYRSQGGPRKHLIPDFLIGAHAAMQASGLVAMDRGFYRRYFADVAVITPGHAYPLADSGHR